MDQYSQIRAKGMLGAGNQLSPPQWQTGDQIQTVCPGSTPLTMHSANADMGVCLPQACLMLFFTIIVPIITNLFSCPHFDSTLCSNPVRCPIANCLKCCASSHSQGLPRMTLTSTASAPICRAASPALPACAPWLTLCSFHHTC